MASRFLFIGVILVSLVGDVTVSDGRGVSLGTARGRAADEWRRGSTEVPGGGAHGRLHAGGTTASARTANGRVHVIPRGVLRSDGQEAETAKPPRPTPPAPR